MFESIINSPSKLLRRFFGNTTFTYASSSSLPREYYNIDNAKYFYIGTMALIHILYFTAFVGVFVVDQIYVNYLNIFIQTFIVLFLAFRFHPFRTRNIVTSADTTIVFGSAILLGTNLLTVEFAKWIPTHYSKSTISFIQNNIKTQIKNIIT
jgi:hypothetical protein